MKNLVKLLFVAIVAMSVSVAYAQDGGKKKPAAKKEKMEKKDGKMEKKDGKMESKKPMKKKAHKKAAAKKDGGKM